MASPYPYGDGLSDDISSAVVPAYFQPLYPYAHQPQEDTQPPSPNVFSAAAILATLAESRPSTGHGEDAGGFEYDNEPGGISLTDHAIQLAAHYPQPSMQDFAAFVAGSGSHLDPTSHTALDHHAAALEALTMEQQPTSASSTAPQGVPDMFSMPPPNSTTYGHDFTATSYDDPFAISDPAAFFDIASYFNFYAVSPDKPVPWLDDKDRPDTITRRDLGGDACDFQGIDWTQRMPRSTIRARRAGFERERIQSRKWGGRAPLLKTPKTESFFSFRRMDTKHRAHYPHFQLRNVMTVTSRNDVFYATPAGVFRTDASGSPAVPVISLHKRMVNGNEFQTTTIAAANNVLVAGGFEGEYAIADLSSAADEPFTLGSIKDWAPDTRSYISNHVHLFNSRTSYTPQAVLCSNDARLRVLDCLTDTFKHTFTYPSAVNCSATSPDGRMRVVVGDFRETLITNAETGQPFEALSAHVDDAFACAWADDGIHVASAAQDSTIAVWDARYWKQPLTLMPSELSIPRVLKFSPTGSGPRVLVAAEADDYINIINAQTFESKQTFDLFGPTAGVDFSPDGQSLFIANADRRFGGIVELERAGWAEATGPRASPDMYADKACMDWADDAELDADHRVPRSLLARERRGIDVGALVV